MMKYSYIMDKKYTFLNNINDNNHLIISLRLKLSDVKMNLTFNERNDALKYRAIQNKCKTIKSTNE